MDTLGDRVKKLRTAQRWSLRELADRTGGAITAAGISNIESGATQMPKSSTLFPLAKALGVDPDELLTGRSGSKRDTHHAVRDLTPDDYSPYIRQWETEADLGNGDVTIPVCDIRVSAGGGSVVPEYVETTHKLAFSKRWLQKRNLRPQDLKALKVSGESMSPTLEDGECVLVDTSQDRIIDGKIYALIIGGEAKIKRLRRRYDGGLIVMSDNPAPEFPDEEVPADGSEFVQIIGRAIQRSGEI